MSYESRIFVVKPFEGYPRDKEGREACEIIAKFNLSVIDQEVLDVFVRTSHFKIYTEEGEESIISEDKYGDSLKVADAQDVLNAIKSCPDAMKYRRTRDLYEFLKSSIKHYDKLYLVHYGY